MQVASYHIRLFGQVDSSALGMVWQEWTGDVDVLRKQRDDWGVEFLTKPGIGLELQTSTRVVWDSLCLVQTARDWI